VTKTDQELLLCSKKHDINTVLHYDIMHYEVVGWKPLFVRSKLAKYVIELIGLYRFLS